MRHLLCVLILFLSLMLRVHCHLVTIRKTANGLVEGIEKTSSLGQKYYAFLGVPYAEPPITGRDPYTGEKVDRRFKAPKPLKRKWTENLKVQSFKNSCIPSTNSSGEPENEVKKSEDCLFVNIYVPAGGREKKTVLLWIHGGAFAFGDATDFNFGPDFLLSEDNIVVTVQYRIGIFGFLNLGTDEYSGNMGLKDQQLAIKWVYENIEHFSGRNDEILLFGESAGGASVSYHMLNEESRKYFNRVFASSSVALSSYACSKHNHVERMHECSKIKDKEKLIEYLKTANSSVLAMCYPYNLGESLRPPWVPTIENPRIDGAFMTKAPEELYTPNGAPAMDTMFSFNLQEGIPLLTNVLRRTEPLINRNWIDPFIKLPFEGLNETTYPKEYKQAVEKLRLAYFSDTLNSDLIKRGNIDLLSDLTFGYSIIKAIKIQTIANNRGSDETQRKNTFLFRFSVDAGLNLMKLLGIGNYDGATHADDLCYIFHCHMFDDFKLYDSHLKNKDKAYDTIMRMTKMITNFARTGNPSIEGDTPFKSCESSTKIFCQEISNDFTSTMMTNITEQFPYNTWHDIEKSYNKL